ncbi:MAG: sporulation protein YtxC [Thermacetogeniaceae bacterium]
MIALKSSSLIIGTACYAEEIRELLRSELDFFSKERMMFKCDEQEAPPWSFFILLPQDDSNLGEKKFAMRFAVAKALSEFFVNNLEAAYVKDHINKNYNYLSERDREEIIERLLGNMQKLRVIRKNRILQSLYDYLGEHHTLIVEGYGRFRLKGYWNQVQRMIRKGVHEFFVEKDYREFIRLLRCFIELQQPVLSEVHVFISRGGSFYVCDAKGNVIRREHLHAPSFAVIDGEFNYRDYLLSILINFTPKKIVFHVTEELWGCSSIQTIRDVFGSRVTRCPGCEKCHDLLLHKS